MPKIIRILLTLLLCAMAEAEEILSIHRLSDHVTGRGAQGFYAPGGDRVLELKGDFSSWTGYDVREIWIDEYYGTGPLSRKEAAALSQYAPIESITFGRPLEIVRLSGEVLREFQKCPRLTEMTLNVDRIGPDLLSALEGFPNLKDLNIYVSGREYPSLKKAAPSAPLNDWPTSLLKLESLSVFLSESLGQRISNRFLEEMSRSKTLSWLQLSNGTFDERSFEILGTMNLKSLFLTVPDLKGMTLTGLKNSKIRELHLGSDVLRRPAAIRDFDKEAWEVFLEMPELEEFSGFEREMVQWVEPSSELAQFREKLSKHLKENRARHEAQEGEKPTEPEKGNANLVTPSR